jgi:acyl-[acyl-carrier-protein] desaturase
VVIAVGGVYDPRIHLDDVVMPVLKKWRIFEREDFTGEAARMRDDLALLVEELEEACDKFAVAKQRRLEREARMAERLTAKKVLSTAGTLTLSSGGTA